MQALAELGQNTVSPFNPSNSTAGPTVTPRVRGLAFTPVQGQGVQAAELDAHTDAMFSL